MNRAKMLSANPLSALPQPHHNPMNMIRSKLVLLGAVLALSVPAHAQQFGVWLDGNTTVPSSDGILGSLDHAFGTGHWTLLSNADLSASLNAYDTIIMSRSGASFGTQGLAASAVANLQSYVGAYGDPLQGGVALFTNDAKDNWYGAGLSDPFDANLDKLFVNAATFAASTHHGFIGEFNGTVIALNELHLLPGVAGSLGGALGGYFKYAVGPIGSGHPIDTGVDFPFNDGDPSPYLTTVTGASPGTVVDVYTSEADVLYSDGNRYHAPAVMANEVLIQGGHVPDAGSTLAMLGGAIVGLALLRRRL